MALLEYGAAGLATVATDVGQCADVLDDGGAGVVVQPGSVEQLANGLISLLQAPERRSVGESFQARVNQRFGAAKVMEQICEVYDTVLRRLPGNSGKPAFEGKVAAESASSPSKVVH